MTVADGKLIQIMSTASTKWNGIKTMLRSVGIDISEVVYFGDDNDDIEPIKNCAWVSLFPMPLGRFLT